MLRFLADENLNIELVRGVRRKNPAIDVVRAQEVGLEHTPDPLVLAWAAEHGRILLTHDFQTMPPIAYARVAAGETMPGVFLIAWLGALGPVIDDLWMLAELSRPGEWEDLVEYLPL